MSDRSWTVIDTSNHPVEGESVTYSVSGPESDFMFLRRKDEADLIAAAPDLLAECEAILPVLRSQPAPKLGEWNWPLLADRLEAVIAKAQGVPAPTP